MVGPFDITPVNIPGVFGEVSRQKQNALNFRLGEAQLNAFEANQEKQVELARLAGIALSDEDEATADARGQAIEQAFILDPEAGKNLLDFTIKGNVEERTAAANKADVLAGVAGAVMDDRSIGEGDPIPDTFIQQALDAGVPRDQIPTTKNSQQLNGFIFQSKKMSQIFNEVNEGAVPFVRFNAKGEQEIDTALPGSEKANRLEAQGFIATRAPNIDLKGEGISPTGLTKTQEGSENIRLRESEESTANTLKTTARLREQLAEGGVTTGLVGTLARGIDTITSQFEQAGQLFQDDFSPNVVKRFEAEGRFGKFASESQGFKTNLVRLTGALAVMINGGARPSDFDARLAQQLSAMTSGSESQMLAAFDEIDRFSLDTTETIFQSQQRGLPAEQREQFNRDQFRSDFGVGAAPETVVIENHPRLGAVTEQMIQDEVARTGLTREEIIKRLEEERG
jgi:hypothetical protein